MTERPSRDVLLAIVFDEQWRLQPSVKKTARRITCPRKHTLGIALKTPFGWWVAYRTPYAEQGSRWEYDWADQIQGYTEATCHCRRRRRVDEILSQLS